MHIYEETLDSNPAKFPERDCFEVRPGKIGKSLFWKGPAVGTGMTLLPFSGEIVEYSAIPEAMICYVVRFSENEYIVPNDIAMYANHSCDPNCLINDQYCIETIKPLNPGDEITISYDQVSAEDFNAWGHFWDERWTFSCSCNTKSCVGKLAGYRILKK